ncbi:MAG: ATP-binding protein [Proteobacteria bacterium]|nr:ATP-binding protein [Pseudomonadota bacterium]
MMRWLPQSLFGRLALILFGGLLVAQLLSAIINFAERDRMILRASGMQSAQRVADVVKLLDSLSAAERQRIAGILSVPPLVVTLSPTPQTQRDGETEPDSARALMFSAVLRAALGDDREIRISQNEAAVAAWRPGYFRERRAAREEGRVLPPEMQRFPPGSLIFQTQIRLADGSWVQFNARIPQEAASLPWRLLLTLVVLLVAVSLLSLLAVRWVTRPLHVLASAADELGRDIHRPPLPEQGPLEVRRAAHAFNTMQSRLVRYIEDRTRILAAMSHDLKTPITRLRLRAELMEDEDLRQRFEKDLLEMEAMVSQTLDFMRGLDSREPQQPIDIMALLESLQADNEEMGRAMSITGRTTAPFIGSPQFLKRCLTNLLDNALTYGKRALIGIEDGPAELLIRIRDEGPGLPEAELEKVFEPFYRLESSRNRATGGTGLGLSIARNIAQAMGGDVRLRNHPDGGLEALLSLPRVHA